MSRKRIFEEAQTIDLPWRAEPGKGERILGLPVATQLVEMVVGCLEGRDGVELLETQGRRFKAHLLSLGGGSARINCVFCGLGPGSGPSWALQGPDWVNSEPEKQLKQKQMRIIRRERWEG